MTSDFDDQLRALFTSAEQDLQSQAFTAGVTARFQSHRRRTWLLYGAGILITVVILWLLAPDIAGGIAAVAAVPSVVPGLSSRAVRALSESSLTSVAYLYAGVFGCYLLLKVLRQFRVRWV